VSRKIGKTAMATMTLTAHEWKTSAWGYDNGLYAKVLYTELDIELAHFTQRLATYNRCTCGDEKSFGKEHWEHFCQRAAITVN
jgi:methylglutaconyl-CoA hydratase